jgi:hypothetical protein
VKSEINTKIEGAFIVNTVNGRIRFADIKSFIAANIDSWPDKAVLWDLRQMDFHDVSSDELRAFMINAKEISAMRSGEKSAIVAPHDLQFGMMRMFEALAETARIEISFGVFRTIAEAKQWLSEEI